MSRTIRQRPPSCPRRRHRARAALTAGVAAGALVLAGCGGTATEDEPADAVGAAQEQEQTPSEPTEESSEQSEEEAIAEWASQASYHWSDLEYAFSDLEAATTDQAIVEACNNGLDAVVALQQIEVPPVTWTV
ncbi:hypothetical protein [Streptomyces sp. NPDC051684]|uniref:hypothetical protein n=1 Tax=Streptomyces sp. NPDC051684 TaxID=3365670 RepID=UPI0037A7C53D